MAKPLRLRTITAWITSVTPTNTSSDPRMISDFVVAKCGAAIAAKPTRIDSRPKAKTSHQMRRSLARSSCASPAEDPESGRLMASGSLRGGTMGSQVQPGRLLDPSPAASREALGGGVGDEGLAD